MNKNIVISLFDYTGNIVKPWADAGYNCICVDIQHKKTSSEGRIAKVRADVLHWMPKKPDQVAMLFAFPPCTDVAVSGARWFKDKGLGALINTLNLFKRSVDMALLLGCPYMIENPVSVVSSYWRKPDYTFHPHEYAGLCADDNYTKKTCLWTGNGFVMPEPQPDLKLGKPDDRIHKAPPGQNAPTFEALRLWGLPRQCSTQIRSLNVSK